MTRTALLLLLVAACVVVFLYARAKSRRAGTAAPEPPALSLPPPDPDVLEIRGFEFYVRLEDDRRDDVLQAVQGAAGSHGVVYPRDSWAVVLWDDFFAPEAVLRGLSGDSQVEVIWLSFQKQVDAFEFWRWSKGTPLRRLTFGCYEKERTWEHVEGQPEAWEAAAIFQPKDLELEISSVRKYPPDDKSVAEAEAELRAIWMDRKLRVDAEVPNITGRDVAEAAAVAYGLPGWE